MNRRVLLALAAVVVIGVLAVVVMLMSGGDDDSALLDEAAAAFAAFDALQSYHWTLEETTVRTRTGSVDLEERVTQTATGRIIFAEDGTFQMARVSEIAVRGTQNVRQTEENRVYGGVYYVRVSDIDPPEFAAAFPAGWLTSAEQPGLVPPLDYERVRLSVSLLNNLVATGIDADSVTGITALAGETHEGQALRGLEISFAAGELFASVARAEQVGVIDVGSYVAQGNDAAAILASLRESGRVVLRVWIGEDDGMIHRAAGEVDFTLALANGDRLVQRVEETSHYSRFNAAEPVLAPEP